MRCGVPSVVNVTVASEAAKVASRKGGPPPVSHWRPWPDRTALVRTSVDDHRPGVAERHRSPYSIGRVEIPVGSRPASTQPTIMATTGMAITMRNRLFQGM